MGTSSARRAPSSRLWRLAKAAATRYLAPEAAAPVTAGEVVARYLAALKEGAGEETGPLAAFRLTRKAAQDLGALAAQARSRGLPTALGALGLGELAGQPPEILAQGLAAALAPPGGGLEDAVARAALASVLRPGLKDPDPAAWVSRYLATALYFRLALDLGESLEAAAPGFRSLKAGLEGLQAWIEKGRAYLPPKPPPAPEHWQGPAGKLWVTSLLAGWLEQLMQSKK